MEATWFALIALMLTAYVVLDGFDLGAGMLHCRVARSDDERRTVLAAIGPVWDGNEVWLIAAGGVLVFAFPRVYAVAFSGFYLPLMIVLWLFVLRGLSIELRGQLADPLWRSFWDAAFMLSSTAIAFVLGASLGNVLRGVPLDEHASWFSSPLFARFVPGPGAGAFDGYTLVTALVATVLLAAHGAAYLAWKTDGEVGERAFRAARRLWPLALVGVIVAGVLTLLVDGELFRQLRSRPWAWPLPLLALAGFVGVLVSIRRRRERLLFFSSSAILAGLLLATAAGAFPVILRSSVDARWSLTAFNAANTRRGLLVGLAWWTPAMLLAVGYFTYLFRSFAGKVKLGDDHAHY